MSDVELHPRFPVLDTWRAVGALAVLSTHTTFQTGTYLGNGLWGTLLARLDVGVAIFFVLSGFLLSRPWLARAALDLPSPDVRTYLLKRALRVYPVYLVTVVVALALLAENDGTGAVTWVSNLLVADTYVHDQLPHGLTHMWSLTVEIGFYLLLPLLMALALGARRPRMHRLRLHALLLAMVATSVVWHLHLVGVLDPRASGGPGLWLPGYLGWFAAGIWLALVHVDVQQGRRGRVAERVARLASLPGTCWALVAGLMLVVATPIGGPVMFVAGSPAQSVTKNLVYTLVAALVVLSGVFADTSRGFGRVLSSRPLLHLGRISYSIFCIHLVVLALLFELTSYDVFTGSGLQVWALTVVLTLAVSEVLYRFVESPFMRLGHRRTDPDDPSSATDAKDARATIVQS